MDSFPTLRQSVAVVKETSPSNFGYTISSSSVQCAARDRSQPVLVESVRDTIAVLAACTNVRVSVSAAGSQLTLQTEKLGPLSSRWPTGIPSSRMARTLVSQLLQGPAFLVSFSIDMKCCQWSMRRKRSSNRSQPLQSQGPGLSTLYLLVSTLGLLLSNLT